jgi:hypothetical protein
MQLRQKCIRVRASIWDLVVYLVFLLWILKDFTAHASNPNYTGGRDQEDLCSKPALGKSWKTHHKTRAGRVTQAVRVPA